MGGTELENLRVREGDGIAGDPVEGEKILRARVPGIRPVGERGHLLGERVKHVEAKVQLLHACQLADLRREGDDEVVAEVKTLQLGEAADPSWEG